MAWITRLLCFTGFHRWDQPHYVPGWQKRACRCCPRREKQMLGTYNQPMYYWIVDESEK